MHYLSTGNKCSKSPNYDEIELQKINHDVISVTPSPLYHTEKRHQNNVTKALHFDPPLNKKFG